MTKTPKPPIITKNGDYWICGKCGKENPSNYGFCSKCGPS